MNIKKGSLVQRELMPKAAEGLFYDDILFLQSLRHGKPCRLPLHKREALYHTTVHLKGVTHYFLRSKMYKKEYEQIVRTPFVSR